MSWLGDNADFEWFNAKKLLKNVWEKPDQTLLGAQDPTGAAIWNGILGEDKYDANLNLLGGPSGTTWLDPGAKPGNDTYSQAEAAGINTKPAEQTHDAAEAIAIMYLLNAGGSAIGGGGAGAAGGAEAGAAGGAGGGAAGGGLEGAMAAYGNTGGGLLGDFSTAASSGSVGGIGQGAGSSLGGSGLGAGMGWTGSFGGESAGASTSGGWQDTAKKFMNQGQSQMQGQQQQAQQKSAERSSALQQQIMADLLRQDAQSRAESQAWNANQRGGGSWKV